MSDDGDTSWTDREIVQRYFPATDPRLIPRTLRYRLQPEPEGRAVVIDADGTVRARLVPVPSAGNPTAEMACDLCRRSGTRRFVASYRLETHGQTRRTRYLAACRDLRACERRREDDAALSLRIGSKAH